jgi:hypothetical protein
MENKMIKKLLNMNRIPFFLKDFIISKTSIITWPFIVLFFLFYIAIFFVFIYVNNILYPNVLADNRTFSGLITTSWTLVISFSVLGLVIRGLFHLSAKRKQPVLLDELNFHVVEVLPENIQLQIEPPLTTTLQTQVKIEEHAVEEVKSLVPLIKKSNQPEPETLDQDQIQVEPENDVNRGIAIKPDFSSFATTFDTYMESHGLSGKNGHVFISLMVMSRFIVLEDQPLTPEVFATLNKFFAGNTQMLDGSQISNQSLESLPNFIDVIKRAQRYPSEPQFVHIKDMDPLALSTCFAGFSDYAFFPNRVYAVKTQGETISLPNNLWFVITLKKGSTVFSIPSSIRSQIVFFNGIFEKIPDVKPLEVETSYHFNYLQASRVLSPTYPSEHLSEDLWKKVDQWTQVMAQVNQYELNNETMIHLENAIITLLSLKIEPLNALDIIFSSSLLVHALPRSTKDTYQKETDMQRFFESTFGRKTFALSISLFNRYKNWNH